MLLQRALLSGFFLTSLAVSATGQVAINDFTFRQYDGGPAWAVGQKANSGDSIAFSFTIEGLKAVETEQAKKVAYTWEAIPIDAKGRLLADPVAGKAALDILPEDKDWKPRVTGNIKLPTLMAGAEYKLVLSVKDELGDTEAKREFPFPVAGPAVFDRSSLGIEEISFYRNEDDTRSIDPIAYRPGDTVWIRFQIAGIQARGKDVHVRYGFQIADSTGKVVLDQAMAGDEEKSQFYPPAYLPATVSFTPDNKVAKGTYSVLFRVEDVLSAATANATARFRIE